LALQHASIDAASFSSIRLLSGALSLAAIVRLRTGLPPSMVPADWVSAAMLFAYMACFSFAYLSLAAGTGALILFGAVQLTMCVAGWRAGERFGTLAACGFVAASAGLVALVLPGVTAPAPPAAALMAAAGVAWGIYSLRGRGIGDPLATTSTNFLYAAAIAVFLSLLLMSTAHANTTGLALAVASGALTSGVGYVVWYAAVRGLTALRAATVQLSVPPLAAFGGVLWLGESVSPRLVGTSAAILGGIALVVIGRSGQHQPVARTR
jgi:drug/metabolite transporter (DMT)-like permease